MKKILFMVCAVAVLMIPVTARSTTIQFNIDTLLTGTAPTSAAPWLTFTFTDQSSNKVRFTITSSLEVSSEFISNIVFNVDPSLTPSLINFTFVSSTGAFAIPTASDIKKSTPNAQSLSPADNFDIAINFKTANNQRFNNTDSITWDLTYGNPAITFNANSFNFFNTEDQAEYSGFYAVAMFQGIPIPGSTQTTSGKLGDKAETVPEPSTLLLLGAGLLGFGILGRRKFRG
jgi:hypothetical protein